MKNFQSQLIKTVENYHESRSYMLSKLGKDKEATSLYEEMFIDSKSPDSYIFISII